MHTSLRFMVGNRDVKFEPTGPALGPKLDPTGLLYGLDATCWAHAENFE